jgi:NADPH-dependent curcumin reductase CurA
MQGLSFLTMKIDFLKALSSYRLGLKKELDFTQTMEGFDQFTALLGLFEGINTGKMIVKA